MQVSTESSAASSFQTSSSGVSRSDLPLKTAARAREAQKAIRKLSVSGRLAYLGRLKRVILEDRERLIDAIQKDTGKSRSDALMSEIFPILDHLAYLEKHAAKQLADRKVATPLALLGKSSWVYFEPMGTILVISPWNYPFYQAIVPCTAAFITGNAAIYKPSEHTPLKGLVEDVLAQAGFDPSWVQVVYGDGTLAQELIDTKPEKIFFTGSVATGKKIMAQASRYLIPVELELGGKDPMVVFEDANIDRAAAGAVWGAFTNAGQSCTSVERVYVQAKIYDKFRDAVVRESKRIKLGVDADGDADFGRMTTDFQVKTVRTQLEAARAQGAKLLTGQEWNGTDSMVPPLVVEGAKPDSALVKDETFGPVLPLVPFTSEDEVVRLCNDSEYGLSASVWSADMERCKRVARALVTGNVSVNNVMLTEGNHALPFGGVKSSGFGRYKGEFGLYAFSNVKSVLLDKNSAKIEANWYPYTKTKYQLFTRMMLGLFQGGLMGFVKFALAGMKLESYSAKVWKKGRS